MPLTSAGPGGIGDGVVDGVAVVVEEVAAAMVTALVVADGVELDMTTWALTSSSTSSSGWLAAAAGNTAIEVAGGRGMAVGDSAAEKALTAGEPPGLDQAVRMIPAIINNMPNPPKARIKRLLCCIGRTILIGITK